MFLTSSITELVAFEFSMLTPKPFLGAYQTDLEGV
jgi:hypothetical protein